MYNKVTWSVVIQQFCKSHMEISACTGESESVTLQMKPPPLDGQQENSQLVAGDSINTAVITHGWPLKGTDS